MTIMIDHHNQNQVLPSVVFTAPSLAVSSTRRLDGRLGGWRMEDGRWVSLPLRQTSVFIILYHILLFH